jgi:GTPase SAR1 family protein
MISNNNRTSRKIPGFSYYNSRLGKTINIQKGLKHILVFGQSRQGKSSIINMMTGLNKSNGADVSPNVIGCTFSTEPWTNNEYCFWDTAGLNEQDDGFVSNKDSTKNLISFIRQSRGFHAAMMVVSWNNVNSSTTKQNWDLFYDCFLDQRVPIIICITGRGIETSDEDQNWINNQQEIFNNLGYGSKTGNGFKCVVYSKELSEIKNLTMKTIYEELRERSIGYINTVLRNNTTDDYYNPLDEMNWFDVVKKVWNTLMSLLRLDNFMITVGAAFKEFLIKIGFNNEDAEVIAKETYFDG